MTSPTAAEALELLAAQDVPEGGAVVLEAEHHWIAKGEPARVLHAASCPCWRPAGPRPYDWTEYVPDEAPRRTSLWSRLFTRRPVSDLDWNR